MSDRPTVAIIGAGGFVGGRLAEYLLLHDLATVRPITRSFKGHARLSRFVLDARIADATSESALTPHLKGCDTVYHCVVGGHETIVASVEAAYRAAAAAGVRRLVYLSSAVVHGDDPAPGTDEDTPLIKDQPFAYNVSKVIAESRLEELRQDGRVETVVLRPCIVFGPRSQWWTAQIAKELLAGSAYLIDGGSGICNTVYIDNLVNAMWLAAIRPEAANQTFLITDGERVTWRELYESVATALDMDLSGVPSVDAATVAAGVRAEEKKQRADRARSTLFWQMARPLMSSAIKGVLLRLYDVPAHPPRPAPPASAAVIKPPPVVDREIASLQSWRYVLPILRARTLLGYEPRFTFADGAKRTAEWLRFSSGISTGSQS
jgi:nucleoside-diphosphate-sugar epimerase